MRIECQLDNRLPAPLALGIQESVLVEHGISLEHEVDGPRELVSEDGQGLGHLTMCSSRRVYCLLLCCCRALAAQHKR